MTISGSYASQYQKPLTIGLVNNMSPPAMAQATMQFTNLLNSVDQKITIVCFTMKSESIDQSLYLPIEDIQNFQIDAVIVTGMEVTKSSLQDESIWPRFGRLYDHCSSHSIPTIWSCLAAHAAVLYRDGIQRQPMPNKLSGLFTCTKNTYEQPLMKHMPDEWKCPHSRYNGLSYEDLLDHGYVILSQGTETGTDIFMHPDEPASFYFQGHPEYQADTILLEFIRDMRRYEEGKSNKIPGIPRFYFDTNTTSKIDNILKQRDPDKGILEQIQACISPNQIRNCWSHHAIQLYTNWIRIAVAHADKKTITSPYPINALPIQ